MPRYEHITNNDNWNQNVLFVKEGEWKGTLRPYETRIVSIYRQRILPLYQKSSTTIHTLFWTLHHIITGHEHITNDYNRNDRLSSSQERVNVTFRKFTIRLHRNVDDTWRHFVDRMTWALGLHFQNRHRFVFGIENVLRLQKHLNNVHLVHRQCINDSVCLARTDRLLLHWTFSPLVTRPPLFRRVTIKMTSAATFVMSTPLFRRAIIKMNQVSLCSLMLRLTNAATFVISPPPFRRAIIKMNQV